MNYVLFIGDKPSAKNVSDDVAFVGTKSYSRLLTWIDKMNLSVNQVQLANKGDVYHIRSWVEDIHSWNRQVEYETKHGIFTVDKVVALGNEAAKFCADHELDYFKLFHPSGRNFKLNDKKAVEAMLNRCEQYIKRS